MLFINQAQQKAYMVKNYLLTSESWKVSDISAMLNNETPKGNAKVFYQNNAAKQDLGISFSPAHVPLKSFSAI